MEEQSFGSCSCLLVLQKKRWKWQKESVGRGREDEDEKDAWDLFFDLERLELATDHFSEENLLGRGGFGPVYKIWKLAQEEKALDAVDHSLTNWDSEEVALCIQLGLLCCQAKVKKRPEMGSVLLMLSGDSFTLPKPGKPGILGRQGHWSSTASTNFNSNNNTPNSSSTGATKPSTSSSIEEDSSRNSISVSFTEEGR
ncbi:hypothetical protein MRB53_024010 [Persea americana]|uniref:Uncharacterized protein n=1 Tax=Persea americana TaxID=3435 RepID=A0ACC2LAZ5_PERAE|nr:hypothetical protein MRB53_024010 [Persea americana]